MPRGLRRLLPEADVSTVQQMGWAGLSNGALLARASEFEVFVTADCGIEHQQNLTTLGFGVVLLIAASNRLDAYVPLANELDATARSRGRRGEEGN